MLWKTDYFIYLIKEKSWEKKKESKPLKVDLSSCLSLAGAEHFFPSYYYFFKLIRIKWLYYFKCLYQFEKYKMKIERNGRIKMKMIEEVQRGGLNETKNLFIKCN